MTVLFALLAGMLTIAAPCTLPVLPILLGGSIGQTGRFRPFFIVLGFVTSFATAVLVFSAIGEVIGIDQNTLRDFAAVLLILFGILLLWPRLLHLVVARSRALVPRSTRGPVRSWGGNVGGFALGTTLGLVWTPCAGPILASILVVIATSPGFSSGALLLLAYAIGAALPMLAIAYGGQIATTRARSIARVSGRLQQGFGAVIICFAVALYYQYDAPVTAWLSNFYPEGRIGL